MSHLTDIKIKPILVTLSPRISADHAIKTGPQQTVKSCPHEQFACDNFNVGNTFERVDSTTIIVDNSQLRGFTSVFKANALEHYWAKSLTLKRFGREIKDLCVSRGTLQKGSDVKLGIHQQVYRR